MRWVPLSLVDFHSYNTIFSLQFVVDTCKALDSVLIRLYDRNELYYTDAYMSALHMQM